MDWASGPDHGHLRARRPPALVLHGRLSYFTTRHFLLAGRESAAQHRPSPTPRWCATRCRAHGNYPACWPARRRIGRPLRPLPRVEDLRLVAVGERLFHSRRAPAKCWPAMRPPRPTDGRRYGGDRGRRTPPRRQRPLLRGLRPVRPRSHPARPGPDPLRGRHHHHPLGDRPGSFRQHRLLRPLADVSRAAGAISGGELDTRLDPDATDPDLADLTNSFNAMVDQLQVRIERETRFNSDVSHELRSPLTTLAASLEVLEAEQDHLSRGSQRALQLLGDDLRRFQRMVSDLLEMSRVDAGSSRRLPRRGRRVRTGAAVGRSGLRPWTARGRHRRGADRPRRPWLPRRGGQTALRAGHGQPDGERVQTTAAAPAEIAGRAVVETMQVLITVDDAGPGIDPAERSKVFDRFYRGSASGRRGTGTGSGLGLALVAEHMRLMGGKVRVETSPQGGARLELTLPVHQRRRALGRRRGGRRREGRLGVAVIAAVACCAGRVCHPDPGRTADDPRLEGAAFGCSTRTSPRQRRPCPPPRRWSR